MDKEEKFRETALFRYSLIAPAVVDTFEASSRAQYFRNIAAKMHTDPDGKLVKVTCYALQRWYYAYKKSGLAGITPKERSDIGSSRALTPDAISMIYALKDDYPYITGKAVLGKLVEGGAVNADEASVSSVQRFIRINGLKAPAESAQEMKAFEMEFANVCWQADTSHGPVIEISGRKTQTYLILFLDDASRLIPHAQFYLSDNAVNMQDSFKKAIAKFGVPKMLYVDNGKSYDNQQLQLICASIGIALVHARPYAPTSKGKCERAFRTIKDGWMNAVDWKSFSSLDELDSSLAAFLSEKYTNSIHSSLNCTPKERYLRDYGRIRHMPAEELDFHFLHRKECRVTNAATIKLLGTEYETPQQYIGSKIKVRYLPTDMSELFVYSDDDKLLHTIRPVRKVENSKIKRAAIDYTKAGGAL